jgi:hypothetical protein
MRPARLWIGLYLTIGCISNTTKREVEPQANYRWPMPVPLAYRAHRLRAEWGNRTPPLAVEDVHLDCASAPGVTVNGHFLWQHVLEIEPSARDPIHTLIQHPNCVERVSRRNEHTVAGVKILLSYLFKRTCLLDPGRQRFRDGSQISSPAAYCAFPIGHVNSRLRHDFDALATPLRGRVGEVIRSHPKSSANKRAK